MSASGAARSLPVELIRLQAGGEVTTGALMQALKHADRPVPLIMLSSCSGGYPPANDRQEPESRH